MSAEEYLAWISDVDRSFDYYGIPDDGSRVVRVVYRLRGKASTWWEKLENNRLQDGRNLVFTWRHMKQLLKCGSEHGFARCFLDFSLVLFRPTSQGVGLGIGNFALGMFWADVSKRQHVHGFGRRFVNIGLDMVFVDAFKALA
ncbi:hypothetical protein CRG98_018809 [Punica granatum]|uniref:Retrotransposon gag domain-containing protein n=1 Tax=Punica granatum TaxID=22663 RepID=A0A2I0JYC5_PUNGR|nr:hypothetical protein CRG98_018809 [Punica granatum]